MQKHSKLFLLTLALLLAAQAALAEENITELKIEEIGPEATCGSFFNFSYIIGNHIGPPCKADIEYWLGSKELMLVEGTDALFLGEGETRKLDSFLLVPETECGNTGFFLQMQCNDATALASRPIKITNPIDTTPKILALQIMKHEEHEDFEFSYAIKSYKEEPHPVTVEETVSSDGNVVWSSNQTIMLAGTEEFSRHGPMLPPAQYNISILLTRGKETSKVTQDFDIKATGFLEGNTSPLLPALPLTILGLVSIATVAILWRLCKLGLFRKSGAEAGQFAMNFTIPKKAKSSAAINPETGEEENRNYVCLVESDSKRLLEAKEANSVLDDAGFSQEEKKTALAFISQVPVSQTVKSAVFIDKFGKPKCETSVTIIASNNSSKDWCDVALLAKIPSFLSENISEIKAGEDIEVVKHGRIAKFTIPKIAAMQSASLVYSIEKWIPQDKAKLVPLPAVINYEEGLPLTVKLKYGKAAESEKNSDSIHIAEKVRRARKKKSVKKAGKKA